MAEHHEPRWRIEPGAGRDLRIGIIGCGGIVSGAHLPAYQAAGLERRGGLRHRRGEGARRSPSSSASRWWPPRRRSSRDGRTWTSWTSPSCHGRSRTIVPIVAAAGKHMLCQKPLAMDYATGVMEVETAERPACCWPSTTRCAGTPASPPRATSWRRASSAGSREAQVQVSVSTPLHLWAWIAESPHLDIRIHSTHYLDALRSILGDPEWVTSIHGRYPQQAPVIGETVTKTILEHADGAAGARGHEPLQPARAALRGVPLPRHARACWRGPSASCTTTPTAVPTRSRSTARGARSRPSTSTRDGCPMPSWAP